LEVLFPGSFQLMFKSKTGVKNIGTMVASINQKDLLFLAELLKVRQNQVIIDKRFPLADTPKALHTLKKAITRGKIVTNASVEINLRLFNEDFDSSFIPDPGINQ